MLAWWSNVFAMLGVALIATAFFRPDWQAGCVTGIIFILFGAILKGLSIPANGERK